MKTIKEAAALFGLFLSPMFLPFPLACVAVVVGGVWLVKKGGWA